jgi:hypothetical protein
MEKTYPVESRRCNKMNEYEVWWPPSSENKIGFLKCQGYQTRLKLSPPPFAVILGPAAFQKSRLCPFKPKKWRNVLGLMFYNRVIAHTYNNYDNLISLCKYQCWTGSIFCTYQIGIGIIYILPPTLLIGSATSISCHMGHQIQSSTSRMKTNILIPKHFLKN